MPYLDSEDERRRRILEAMAQSIAPQQKPVAQPTANVRLPPPSVTPTGAPPEATGSLPPQQPKVRIGYSTTGLTGVDQLLQRRKAYEDADPESNVRVSPDFAEIEPPQSRKGFKGRLKSLGEGALLGLAMSDPDRPLSGLGGAIGGATLGAVSPRGEKKLLRRFETLNLDNDIARGLKLKQEQAQLSGMESLNRQREIAPQLKAAELEREYEVANAKLEIERQKAAGLITKAEADRQQRELDRASREKIAADRIQSSEKIAGMRPSGVESRQAKREAKINESSALYKKAEAMEANAVALDEHIAKLEAGKASILNDPDLATDKSPDRLKLFDVQVEELKKQQAKLKSDANDLRTKGDAARAEGESIPESTTARYAGRTMSQANLERYAKDKGMTVEAAKAKLEKEEGIIIR